MDLEQRVADLEAKLDKMREWGVEVQTRLSELEKAPKPNRGWSTAEEQFLTDNYSELGPDTLVDKWYEEFGHERTKGAITARASKLKLKLRLSKQDTEIVDKLIQTSLITKDKAISLARELKVSPKEMANYLQYKHKVGTDEGNNTTTTLAEQWGL